MKQSTKTTNRAFMHNNIPYRYCYEEGGMIDEKGAGDAYSHLKNLYNNVLQENCDIGHNNFARTVYLTITTEVYTPEQALEIFAEADTWIKEIFYSLYGFFRITVR